MELVSGNVQLKCNCGDFYRIYMYIPLDSRVVRITSNPMPLTYVDPEDALIEVTSFDNPNHIQLPSASATATAAAPTIPFDTATYNKRDRVHGVRCNRPRYGGYEKGDTLT